MSTILQQLDAAAQRDLSGERRQYAAILYRADEPSEGDAQMLPELLSALGLSRSDLERDIDLVKKVQFARELLKSAEGFRHTPEQVQTAYNDVVAFKEKARLEIIRLQQVFDAAAGSNQTISQRQAELQLAQREAAAIGFAVKPEPGHGPQPITGPSTMIIDPATGHRSIDGMAQRPPRP